MNEPAERVMPAVVELPAEIDVTNSGQVYDELVAALASGGRVVIANLMSTTFCDSSGVRAIIHAYETAVASNARLRLAVSTEGSVRRVLELTGAASLMPLYPSLEEAVEAA